MRLPDPEHHSRLIQENERLSMALSQTAELYLQQKAKRWELTRNLVELRVSQSDISRAGWAVMCFIPEEVVKVLQQERKQGHPPFVVPKYESIVHRVTEELVRLAIDGVLRIDREGKVSALVFEPLDLSKPPAAPRFVQALFESDGKFKLSNRCWDQRTEEQRVKSAAGLPGFGV